MPVGGAADRAALALGNALVGNPPNTLALEITLAGPTLEATGEHACAVMGAPFALWLNSRPLAIGRTFTVRSGDLLQIATPERGLRAYLCVRGGFEAPEILGSRSAFEPLQAGAELVCPPSTLPGRFIQLPAPPADEQHLLRVLRGTHAEQFPADVFVSQEYTVSADSNRMGLRLEGRPLPRSQAEELLSAPVCPGTVQVTNDGLPVVLGVDAQTIGGYPRLAHVITADLDKLGQLRPGETVRFTWVDPPAARELLRVRQAWLRGWVTRLLASAA